MLETYFEHPFTLHRLRSGPATPYIDGFAAALHAKGYTKETLRNYLPTAPHFARWSQKNLGIDIDSLDAAALKAFELHLPTCCCLRRDPPTITRYSSNIVRASHLFLEYLQGIGVAPTPARETKPLPVLIEGFEHWMRFHRGVRDCTLHSYRRVLIPLIETLGEEPAIYNPAGLRRFIVNLTGNLGSGWAKQVATATRMFLRYLDVEGRCSPGLDGAVPRVSAWAQASLPRYLPAKSVDRMIASCNTQMTIGMRDQAILLLLARLGLRPSDVTNLCLGDIDWAGARLCVTGKGRRESWLPLPQDVGNAILLYLEQGRPDIVDDARIFFRIQAPITPFGSASSINGVVRRSARRSGIKKRNVTAYTLRHSAATEMLRQGASLGQIGVVLRHRKVDTTTIYAKVDVASLREVAQPWPFPGRSPCC
jgi:integrase/recombinase XerD